MNRKTFMISRGAKCQNWTWSWSFINKERNIIYFGAWDKNTEGNSSVIFDENWEINDSGRKSAAYHESHENIKLVESGEYKLFTFPIIYSNEKKNENGIGPATIKKIIPILTEKKLIKRNTTWYAEDIDNSVFIPEEIQEPEKLIEGAKKSIIVNSYERNRKAREICISHYGLSCVICGFNFQSKYGDIGIGLIHVHHLTPISKINQQYSLDPIKDLRPVCPNCHAIIHSSQPILSLDQLQSHINKLNK